MNPESPAAAWQVLMISGVFPAIAGAWKAYQYFRKDRREERAAEMTVTEKIQADLLAQRAALSREQVELFERMRLELARAHSRADELEDDRDRGWDLARYWYRLARELQHALRNTQTIVDSLCTRVVPPEAPRVWVPIHVPTNLEDPPKG